MDDEYWSSKPDVLTPRDTAKIVKKSEVTVWRWLKEGDIPAHQIGGAWLIYKEELRTCLDVGLENTPLVPTALLAQFADEMSAADLAILIGKTKQTAYNWLAEGILPGRQIRGQWVIFKSEVVALLEATSNRTK
jgi:excisionase family DNA binding protein